MHNKTRNEIIAIEEHYVDPILIEKFPEFKKTPPHILAKLLLTNEERIMEMDKVGIDMQILSHNHPGSQIISDRSSIQYAAQINNNLKRRIDKNPERFGGFATLPMQFPEEAAAELERCVIELGFHGAMIHGTVNGTFFDAPKFKSVFQAASEVQKPVYVHPGNPIPSVSDAYYSDYATRFPLISTAAWGFGVEAATSAIRLILSGIFLEFPGLKIVLGHLGEGLPFLLERCHAGFSTRRPKSGPDIDFRKLFHDNFYITTSGNFSDAALACSLMELGADKIMFAVDWPYNKNELAINWINNFSLSKSDRHKIMSKNASDLLGICSN